MLRHLMVLIGTLIAFSAQAISNQELLLNLSSRIHDLPAGRGSLIKSFTDHSQSYIYDQALAIIAFTKESDQPKARKLLLGLKSLQLDDGSLYFSYFLDGTSPYPVEGDKRISGSISWVAIALSHYQSKFKSKEFLPFNNRILTYLHSEIIPFKNYRALRFAPNDIPSTNFLENDVVALEHNLDAYAAFVQFANLNGTEKWKDEISDLKKFIISMWDKNHSHFWSGANIKSGNINRSELYLDNQTWSLLALDSETLKEISPDNALKTNCEQFLVQHEGVNGFFDSKPARSPASHKFVWSEGTLGQVLAMKKLSRIKNETVYCKEFNSTDLLTSVRKMKQNDGGIAYATNTTNKDFSSSSSVAGTAWLYFASNDVNPFHLD